MGKKIKGIAIAPGVSRNGRLYTRENLARAYARLSERITEGTRPVVMRTHHDAGDDSLRISARVTGVSLTTDGAIAYEALPMDTSAGRDIVKLAEGQNKALAHVSVYGAWVDAPKKITFEGRTVETADDLEIDKIDFTATPGVVAASARVETFQPSEDPLVIAESMRPVMFADETPVNEAAGPADVCVSLSSYCGDYSLSIYSYTDSDSVDACTDTAQRALTAALAILQGGPMNDDGDATEAIDDDAMETQTHETTTPKVEEKEAVQMTTDTKPAEPGTEAVTETAAPLTKADIADALVEALKAAGVIKETESEETPVEETAGESNTVDVDKLRESIKTELLKDLLQEGAVKPQRKGYRIGENVEPEEPAWEDRGDDFARGFGLMPEDDAAAAGA